MPSMSDVMPNDTFVGSCSFRTVEMVKPVYSSSKSSTRQSRVNIE
jgi:hypothetical protein